MKSLSRKMFWVLFLVLSILISTFVVLIGLREYGEIRSQIEAELNQSNRLLEHVVRQYPNLLDDDSDEMEEFKSRLDEPLSITTDYPTYVIFTSYNSSTRRSEISEISFYNTDGSNLESIYGLAEEILENHRGDESYLGNLLDTDYAWSFKRPGSLTIINVEQVHRMVWELIGFWAVLYGLALLLIYWICKVLVRWMIAPIEETFAKQRQFIADASHELKTPLAVIYSNTQAFEKDHDLKWIRNIEDETSRMNGLITDLLELTRTEQTALKKEVVNLSKVLQKEVLAMEAIMFEKGIQLKEEITPDLYIQASHDKIRQVILILLDNAIHHAESEILVELFNRNNEIYLTVSNNGEGISPEDLPHIFERFYRSEKSRNRNENRFGLGLAIAKNIVDLHDGNISVQSSSERTCFTVRFKRYHPEKQGLNHKRHNAA